MIHVSRIALLTLALLALLSSFRMPPAFATASHDHAAAAWVPPNPDAAQSSVIVYFDGQPVLQDVSGATRAERRASLVDQLQARAESAQAQVRAMLAKLQAQGRVSSYTVLWGINAIAITADTATIQLISRAPGVAGVAEDATLSVNLAPVVSPSLDAAAATSSLAAIKAPELWAKGILGDGVVVAILDSGVRGDHPDLQSKYRGGTNSWFDPYNQHATPADIVDQKLEFSGHGTQVAGIILGGDASGESIGVAPNAKWIAAKIFDDSGSATESAIHAAFQWLLDPDGDPSTDDAPDIVNNSWAMRAPVCDLRYVLDIQNLLGAGILPIFAAGNYGPDLGSGRSPANNPGAFPVGAVDDGGSSIGQSSRGPDSCGGNTATFPSLVAPGYQVTTAQIAPDDYTSSTGTSFSAPMVAGGLALLLSSNAFPTTAVGIQRNALIAGATDLGDTGPDSTYGAGMLDLLASYTLLLNGTVPAVTSTPTPTPTTPTPTTPTPTTPTPTPPSAPRPATVHVFIPVIMQ